MKEVILSEKLLIACNRFNLLNSQLKFSFDETDR